tara:strand:- start:690 stop:1214 length:525 start_codon:yes stop_codon:yes gene_type:complete
MSLATVGYDESGKPRPSVRIVLLKEYDETGFVFYTNLESRKGEELKAEPQAALCFHWKSLKRQIRIEGDIEQVTEKQAQNYYNGRPRGSRISAWASRQSRPLQSRETFEAEIKTFEEKFQGQNIIPKPPFWSGFRLKPTRFEFWEEFEYRRHNRFIFLPGQGSKTGWDTQRLYP